MKRVPRPNTVEAVDATAEAEAEIAVETVADAAVAAADAAVTKNFRISQPRRARVPGFATVIGVPPLRARIPSHRRAGILQPTRILAPHAATSDRPVMAAPTLMPANAPMYTEPGRP